MRILLVLSLCALAACGVDGLPEQPEESVEYPPTGISISGDARIGVVGRL